MALSIFFLLLSTLTGLINIGTVKAIVVDDGDSIVTTEPITLSELYTEIGNESILSFTAPNLYTLYNRALVPYSVFTIEDAVLTLDDSVIYTAVNSTLTILRSTIQGLYYGVNFTKVSVENNANYNFQNVKFKNMGTLDATNSIYGVSINTTGTGTIENIELEGLGLHGLKISGQDVFIDGITAKNMAQRIIQIESADNITINNLHDSTLNIGNVNGSFGVWIEDSTNIVITNSSNLAFKGRDIPFTSAINILDSDGVEVLNFDHIRGADYFVKIGNSANVVISNNSYLSGFKSDVISTSYLFGNYTLKSSNITIENNHHLDLIGATNWGIHIFSSDSVIIRGNHDIYGGDTDAIGIEDNSTNILVEGNYNLYNNNLGIVMDAVNNGTIQNNYNIYNNKIGGIRVIDGFTTSTNFTWQGAENDVLKTYDIVVRNNTLTNNGFRAKDTPIQVPNGNGGIIVRGVLGYPYDISIYNNTLINNYQGLSFTNDAYGTQAEIGLGSYNVNIFDNIIQSNSYKAIHIYNMTVSFTNIILKTFNSTITIAEENLAIFNITQGNIGIYSYILNMDFSSDSSFTLDTSTNNQFKKVLNNGTQGTILTNNQYLSVITANDFYDIKIYLTNSASTIEVINIGVMLGITAFVLFALVTAIIMLVKKFKV